MWWYDGRTEASDDQREEMNYRLWSDVMLRGMQKHTNQWREKACAHSSAEMLVSGIALGQCVERSMMVRMYKKLREGGRGPTMLTWTCVKGVGRTGIWSTGVWI